MSQLMFRTVCACAVACLWSAFASAGTITCMPNTQRVATLGDAIECKTLNSVNLNTPADIDGLYDDGDPLNHLWVKRGERTSAGTNDLLTVTLNQGSSWGTNSAGMWYIDASFWTMYSRAVITMHVGQGGGDPDAFAWEITPNQVSGAFSYQRVSGGGGGLSNMFLFGTGTPNVVSEPNIALLLLLGLVSIGAARRRVAKSQ